MTNHWRDIKNTDLILINGANPAEAHPVGFQWFLKAKLDPSRGPGSGGGARIVHADPRFTRTSAMADIYARIRTGTDVAYFGGLINYVLQNDLTHKDYVENYTNASFVVKDTYSFKDGLFSGYDPTTRKYDVAKWGYETGSDGFAKRDINHPRSVLNLMKTHYSRYTPEMVSRITGIPQDQFMRIAQLVGEMGRPDKVMTIVYAVGLTHHTTGGELIRSGAVLQLLLGNMGRPGGGMNADEGGAEQRRPDARADHDGEGVDVERIDRELIRRRDERVFGRAASACCEQRDRPAVLELLRHQLQEVHRELAQGLVRRCRHQRQRLRLSLDTEAGQELVLDEHLRPGAQGQDAGADALRDDGYQHRAGFQPGDAGAGQPEVAGGYGRAADDEL